MKAERLHRVVALFLALAVALAFMPSEAYAATRKVTVSGSSTSIWNKYISNHDSAKKVKRGTTKITMKRGYGIFRFKAPKTKTYTFTISSVKSKKGTYAVATPMGTNPEIGGYGETSVTYKGSTQAGWYGIAYKVSGRKLKFDGLNFDVCFGKAFSKKSFKVKLKKGQTYYFEFGAQGGAKTTAKLKIK